MTITLHMRLTISPGQWQPWTAVSPLLGLISMAQPSDLCTESRRVGTSLRSKRFRLVSEQKETVEGEFRF